MTTPPIHVGWVLRSSTTGFAVGCRLLEDITPQFGHFVKVPVTDTINVIGLVYDVRVNDDPAVRQLILAGDMEAELVLDQRRNRLVPIEISVLIIGYGRDGRYIHNLPPQPPISLDTLTPCSSTEIREFTERFDYLRLILNAGQIPTDELVAASLVEAANQRTATIRRKFLVNAGREVARLLNADLLRLDGILQQLRVIAAE